jgi:hypothetical protein
MSPFCLLHCDGLALARNTVGSAMIFALSGGKCPLRQRLYIGRTRDQVHLQDCIGKCHTDDPFTAMIAVALFGCAVVIISYS